MVDQAIQPNTPPVRHLLVIGLGLIGGSLAKAARARNLCQQVWGIARSEEVGARAVELGIVDQAATDLRTFVPRLGAGDVIFIAVPTLSMKTVLEQVKACVPAEVTITDGASVKGSVLQDVQAVYGCTPAQIVLGHPIAGSENSGVEAADADLYVKHRVILTPTPETGAEHLARVTALWQAVEAEVVCLAIAEHDEILGATSHLPHAIAFSLVDTLAHDSQNENIFRYAAGGFRDFTRIASSDAVMWRDIMLANDQSVLKAIDLFSANLMRLRTAIETHDEQALLGVFTRAKAARDHFSSMLARKAYSSQTGENWHLKVSPGNGLGGVINMSGDFSAAAVLTVAATICEGSDLTLTHVVVNPTRTGTLAILQSMGADIVISNPRQLSGAPIADIRVRYAPLRGVPIPAESVLLAIDDVPALLIAAACAEGSTELRGAAELHLKEPDRIPAMVDGLVQLGISCTTTSDAIVVHGGQLSGGEVDARGDHRVAMAFAIAGVKALAPLVVKNCACAVTSFPKFTQLAKHSGINIEHIDS